MAHPAGPPLASLLADLTSGDAARAEAAAEQLPAHGEAALSSLESLTTDTNSDTRWWALRSLAGFSQPQAGALLTAALADADPLVRQCAALGLTRRPYAEAAPALLALLGDHDSLLARLAGDALVVLGSGAVEPLIAVLDTGRLTARVEAARALALIGDTRAVPALFKLLGSESAVLEHWANEGLEKMGVGMAFFKP
jgi:HEAT repeat protein